MKCDNEGLDLCQRWLQSEASLGAKSKQTIIAYRHDVTDFLQFLMQYQGRGAGQSALQAVDLRVMRAWLAHCRANGLSARSTARALSSLKGFYRWLDDTLGIDASLVLGIRAPKFQKPLPRPVTVKAAKNLLSTAELQSKTEWIAARDVAVITLLYGCGLRISEALRLTQGDTPLTSSIRITGKGQKLRIVPVLPIAIDAVQEYQALCPYKGMGDDPLFYGVRGGCLNPRLVQKLIENCRNQLNLPATVTPHAMRHSFATHLLAAGGDLRVIQDLLGHTNLSSTQVYTGIDQAQLMKAYQHAHPKGV